MKVFNRIRLGLFISIVLLVGWNEYSASIDDNKGSDKIPSIGLNNETNPNYIGIDSTSADLSRNESF